MSMQEKREQLIFPGLTTYYEEPIDVLNGDGPYLYDTKGNKYTDFYSGVATVHMGYAHKQAAKAAYQQLLLIQHIPTLYNNQPMLDLAEKLATLGGLSGFKMMFCNSGSESIELLSMLSRLYKPESYVLTFDSGYHGMTFMANRYTGIQEWKHHGTDRLKPCTAVVSPYCYRCPYGYSEETCDAQCAEDIEKKILANEAESFCGFLFEPVLGVGGVIIPPRKYVDRAVEIIKRYGGLIFTDEVQTGLWITGQCFGYQDYGFIPDAICLGKGLGNGLPIGCVMAKEELANLTKGHLMYSTFGGNPVVCAYAKTVIDSIDDKKIERVKALGYSLFNSLKTLKSDVLGDVRGKGLLLGMEFVGDQKFREPNAALAVALQEKMKSRKLLVGLGGIYRNVLRIAPSFLVSDNDVDMLIETIKTFMV